MLKENFKAKGDSRKVLEVYKDSQSLGDKNQIDNRKLGLTQQWSSVDT